VRHEEIPEAKSPNIINAILEGAKTMCEVLSGGYIVQPDPPPYSEMTERITITKERKRTIIDRLFILG
jgi:hypothetical protein